MAEKNVKKMHKWRRLGYVAGQNTPPVCSFLSPTSPHFLQRTLVKLSLVNCDSISSQACSHLSLWGAIRGVVCGLEGIGKLLEFAPNAWLNSYRAFTSLWSFA